MLHLSRPNETGTTAPAALPRKRHRSKLTLVLALASVAVASAAAPATASADAFGIQYWGGFTITPKGVPIKIPAGQLAHLTEGGGSYVRKDAANYLSHWSNICNWRIDFRYSDVNGYVYERNRGPLNYNCTHYGARYTYPRANKRPGKTCAELYSNGAFVARQCHSILR